MGDDEGTDRFSEGTDRFSRLFADIEAQLVAHDRVEADAEVADRTRSARGEVLFADRLRASTGRPVTLRVAGAGLVEGVVRDVADEWVVLVDGAAQAPFLVCTGAVLAGQGLAPQSVPAGRSAAARLSLRSVLRSVARDRSPVRLWLTDGHEVHGTLEVIAKDHVELVCHPVGELARGRTVRDRQTLLFSALAVLRPAAGTSSLGW